MNVNDGCNYIILKLTEAKEELSHLKLQKLLYYSQAWYLAFYKSSLFEGEFQAWIHGPVNRAIYDRFCNTKIIYSDIMRKDIDPDFTPDTIKEVERDHIDTILEAYAKYSGSQLEKMTHTEKPWTEARTGYSSAQRCEVVIKEETMKLYYSARLPQSN